MDNASYFQLLNPMVMMLFSAAFYLIYRNDGKSRSATWYMIAYACGAIGFTLDFAVRDAAGPWLGPYVSNVWLLAFPALVTCGVAAQYKKQIPLKTTASCYLAAFALASMFLIVWPSESGRVLALNGGAGALSALAIPILFQVRHKPLAKLLLVLFAVTSLQLFVRPAIVIAFDGVVAHGEAYSKTLYAVTLHFTSAICAISVAATLIFSLGMDMVRRLNKRSETDILTGMLNRRGFENAVDQVLSRADRAPLPMTLIVVDIDNFKNINDSYGHAAGDKVLATFGRLVGGSLRKSDCAGRIGGEEFCVLLWNSDGVSARMVAEGLRTRFNAIDIDGLPEGKRFAASFGVAQWHQGMDYEELFAKADAALYRAKHRGRNRVELDPGLVAIEKAA